MAEIKIQSFHYYSKTRNTRKFTDFNWNIRKLDFTHCDTIADTDNRDLGKYFQWHLPLCLTLMARHKERLMGA